MTPGEVRFASGSFVALCAAIVVNTLFMQNDPAAVAAAKAAREQAAAKAELQRVRQLSVDAIDRSTARKRVRQRMSSQQRSKPGQAFRKAAQRAGQSAAGWQSSKKSGGLAGTALRVQQAKRSTVVAIQRELTERRYQPGLVDGVPGLMTKAAIMAYESDQGMKLTGEPSEELLQRIIFGEAYAASARAGRLPASAKPHAQQVIRTVQQTLATLGYLQGIADGAMGEITKRAIREFEMDNGLVPTGRISGHLVAKLAKHAGRGRLAANRR